MKITKTTELGEYKLIKRIMSDDHGNVEFVYTIELDNGYTFVVHDPKSMYIPRTVIIHQPI